MLLQSYFPFPVINENFQISCVYRMLSERLLHLMTVKLPKVENNPLEEMNTEWDCIVSKTTCFQQIFTGAEKKGKGNFSNVKEYERHKVTNIQVLLFVSVLAVVFLF